jgi:hypothetical protein
MLRDWKSGGVWALLGEEVMILIAFFCSCVTLEMLELEDVPRILGQYDK